MKDVPMPDMGTRLDGLRTAIYEAVAETSDECLKSIFQVKNLRRKKLF
ncbi:MAG: hypothetical protein ACLSCV_10680 [Acutalibacteraceae bacterium]